MQSIKEKEVEILLTPTHIFRLLSAEIASAEFKYRDKDKFEARVSLEWSSHLIKILQSKLLETEQMTSANLKVI